MTLTPNQKLRMILALMAGIIVLVFLNSFVAPFFAGSFSKHATMSVLWLVEFLLMAYLWGKFNQLRIMINKKELEDEKLVELEHDVEKLTQLESAKGSQDK